MMAFWDESCSSTVIPSLHSLWYLSQGSQYHFRRSNHSIVFFSILCRIQKTPFQFKYYCKKVFCPGFTWSCFAPDVQVVHSTVFMHVFHWLYSSSWRRARACLPSVDQNDLPGPLKGCGSEHLLADSKLPTKFFLLVCASVITLRKALRMGEVEWMVILG